ncbi:MAG: BlaI/MecI/CopY family transcriptional regulator [Ruminococcaceae bacterium]|nr:BlaI/MecI/CopY family transcriptional regulator [Oscillospiraceae bacterium]
MSKEIHIAETEWRVMELLWRTPMLTIGDIKNKLADTDWSDSTIKTLVRRLVQKGALAIDDGEGQFRYYPMVDEKTCKRKETENLINRIYNGSVRLLVSNLVSESKLSEAEFKQLIDIIDKMEE